MRTPSTRLSTTELNETPGRALSTIPPTHRRVTLMTLQDREPTTAEDRLGADPTLKKTPTTRRSPSTCPLTEKTGAPTRSRGRKDAPRVLAPTTTFVTGHRVETPMATTTTLTSPACRLPQVATILLRIPSGRTSTPKVHPPHPGTGVITWEAEDADRALSHAAALPKPSTRLTRGRGTEPDTLRTAKCSCLLRPPTQLTEMSYSNRDKVGSRTGPARVRLAEHPPATGGASLGNGVPTPLPRSVVKSSPAPPLQSGRTSCQRPRWDLLSLESTTTHSSSPSTGSPIRYWRERDSPWAGTMLQLRPPLPLTRPRVPRLPRDKAPPGNLQRSATLRESPKRVATPRLTSPRRLPGRRPPRPRHAQSQAPTLICLP